MSESIQLHSKLGLNPRRIEYACPLCAQKHCDEIALLGNSNKIGKCPRCGTNVIGFRPSAGCPKCKCTGYDVRWEVRELADGEKIPGGLRVCRECEEHMKIGILLVQVDESKTTDKRNPHRTGRIAVITEVAARRVLAGMGAALESVIQMRGAFIEIALWKKLGLPEEDVDNREKTHAGKSDSAGTGAQGAEPLPPDAAGTATGEPVGQPEVRGTDGSGA